VAKIIVLGAGAAGLAAATTLSPFHKVVVVEKGTNPGGIGETLSCKAGTECSVCTACTIPELVEDALADPNIDLMTGTHVETAERTEGGGWSLTLVGASEVTIEADTVLVATGLDVTEGTALPEFGAGRWEGVMTALELDRQLRLGGSVDPIGPEGKVGIIQCVCSRDTSELPYCSRVCCAYTARLALELRDRYPGSEVTVFYMDLQLSDRVAARQIAKAMDDPGISYVRSRPAGVQGTAGAGLEVIYEDTLEGEIESQEFDAVVLSTGLVPSEDTERIARMFGLETDPYGFIAVGGEGPGITSTEGVYASGGATGPVDLVEAGTSGMAAAASILAALSIDWPGRSPRLVLFGEEGRVHDPGVVAEGMGAEVVVLEGSPVDRLWRLDGEPMSFHARVDEGTETIEADVVVIAPPDPDGGGIDVPGAIGPEEAWEGIETGTLQGRTAVVMGTSADALLLAGALKGLNDGAAVDVFYREMAVADGGMQELQLDLAARGVRFHRYAKGSLAIEGLEGDERVVSFADELSPELGILHLEVDRVVAPGGTTQDPRYWPISRLASSGVPPEVRLNVLPVLTPRRGVYTASPSTFTDDAVAQGGVAAVARALADVALGFPLEGEVAHVDPELCAACLNCLRVCPHDAIVFDDEDRAARILERACQDCGLCAAICPAQAIGMVSPDGGDEGD
jgi:heterodisulfide reductase subunit A